MGANTALFGVIYTVLIQPLPFREPGKLMQIWETHPIHSSVTRPLSLIADSIRGDVKRAHAERAEEVADRVIMNNPKCFSLPGRHG
ncbi:MAG: hypothetical protein DMG57_09000 [Acidobacteria bacterium]|nr:MAG: hypothetical protein DMG57_09000 [Acidobacteriota bacterium]